MKPSAWLLLALPALAAHAQSGLIVRPLAGPTATSVRSFDCPASVRPLSNGSVLVSDRCTRQLVLIDSTLTTAVVVADTTALTNRGWGGSTGQLIPFLGDSTLLVDGSSLQLIVLDATGKVGRTMAIRAPFSSIANASGANVDVNGRLIYRTGSTRYDSAAVVRVDLATHRADTVLMLAAQRPVSIPVTSPTGTSYAILTNPFCEAAPNVKSRFAVFVAGGMTRFAWRAR